MNHPAPAGRRTDALWLLVVGGLSSAWCLTAAHELSGAFDETCYVERGLYGWRTGSIKPLMSAGTMPLPVDVQTLPVYLWERHRGTPFDPIVEFHTVLPVCRAANLVFWWLLLLYALRLGRVLGGPWAGRLACGLVAADPNLLAHAALATTDISITATVTMALYYYHVGRDRGWWWRVFVPGLCYGVATLSKASALAFVPLGFLTFAAFRFGSPFRIPRSEFRDLFHMVGIGTVLVFGYCGSDWTTERTFVEWAHSLPDGTLKSALVPVSENLTIFTNAGEGLAQQVRHNVRGHGTYLNGEWHPRATWYYFPVALSAKLPVPALVLLAVATCRPRVWFASPVGWFAAVLLLFSLNCRVQIGIRLVFPLVVMLYVAAAVTLASGGRQPAVADADPSGSRWRIGFAILVVLASALVSASIWPHGMRFVNHLHGGPDAGYRVVSDSNYDWGQGLNELPAHGVANVWYYGTDPAVMMPPYRHFPLHGFPLKCGEDIPRLLGPGRLAVSTTILYGDPAPTPAAKIAIAWLRTQTPVDRTATFLIFEMR